MKDHCDPKKDPGPILVAQQQQQNASAAAGEGVDMQNLSSVLDCFTDRIYAVDEAGLVVFHNAAAANCAAGNQNPLVGLPFEKVLPGFGRLRAVVASVEALSPQDQVEMPLQSTLLDQVGKSVPVEVRIERVAWNAATTDIVICRDTTSRQILTKENQRLVTAISHAADAIVITDAQGQIQYVNPAFCAMTGHTRASVLGTNPRLLKSGHQDAEFYRQMWQTLTQGEVWSGRLVNRGKDGELFTEDTTISPVIDECGCITHFVAAKRDVTREVGLKERLHEAQKLEAVGTLAGGIAHDFNNILYALLGYADLALDDIPSEHPAHTPLQEIARAGNRAATLVAKMLAFGRRTDGCREVVSVAELLGGGLDLVRATLPATIQIETQQNGPDGRVMVDANQIHQVLLNLCTNAQYAMDGAPGVLRIVVDQVDAEQERSGALKDLQPGDWVRIRVIDSGRGIAPAVLDRIFEPYFTTRKGHEGTGLGLATVHGIVADHGGHVSVESEPGVGTEFTILLPLRTAVAPQAPEPVSTGSAAKGAQGHVLVIDDEPMVLNVLEKAITRFGYQVTGFAGGIEALETFRAQPDRFDVVVTDQSMPNITGFEIGTQMMSIRPGLPVVLITGHSDERFHEQACAAGIRYHLLKPISMKELGEVLEELTSVTTAV